MRFASMIARYLLGGGFVIFWLNGFLHFIPQPPMAPGPMVDWMTVMTKTNYMMPVFAFELLGGLLLLVNRYVPLALTILGPILVNILVFHVLLQPAGLPPAIVFVILWFLVSYSVRSAFVGIFQNRVAA